ncbi:secreted RxLR effector protein 161-like [Lycium barbarum]|uniref:secreted RxLR effector protein 161-like n=1 Tax=Lycium barbarum TaxID=112863 RepID=UPI00293E324A|nr:secreted RxLR effector protein 161-like [Lycium barbarum]
MKDLGAAKKILVMEIHTDQKIGKLYLSQRKYFEKVLDRFKCLIVNLFLLRLLLILNCLLTLVLSPKRTLRGCLLSRMQCWYVMVCTRPDLAFAVSMVSRYMHNPRKDHWNAVKWILRCVKGSIDIGLVFDRAKASSYDVVRFLDSNYGGDLDRRRSISGYIFSLCSGAISWKAQLRSIAALSTTEA